MEANTVADASLKFSSAGSSTAMGLRAAFLRQYYIETQDSLVTSMQDDSEDLAVLIQWFESKHDNRGRWAQKRAG